MKNYQFVRLLKRYFRRKSSQDEQSLIEGWYNYYAKQQKVKLPEQHNIDADLDFVWLKISSQTESKQIKLNRKYRSLTAYAASALLLVSAGVMLFLYTAPVNKDIAKVVLPVRSDTSVFIDDYDVFVQMQSGGRLNLDRLSSGEEVSEGRVLFHKNDDGELVYNPKVSGWERNELSDKLHTVFVPKSKRSTIVLSDGTKVWLNSESTITFPEVFAHNERVVEVTGEVYFDVEKDVLKPFFVKTKDAVVKVLGTEFNVNTYLDEPFSSTTLVSGSVSILKAKNDESPTHTLKPGQQWVLEKSSLSNKVSNVNVNDVVSWREGIISFSNLDLKSIMRKVSRIYDVDVVFETLDSHQRFTGGITSKTTLDEFLNIMSMYQVKIDKSGKTLFVRN